MAPLASTSEDLSSDLETSTGTVQLYEGLMETSATQQKKKSSDAVLGLRFQMFCLLLSTRGR